MRERPDFAECKAIGSDGWTSEGMQIVRKEEGISQRALFTISTDMECVLCPFEVEEKMYCNGK
jgi:hypothetical protein